MDDLRAGTALRAIRVRSGSTQAALASRVGIAQSTVSAIESGRFEAVSLRTVRAVANALGAGVDLEVRWRAGDVERLLDRRHAALVGIAMATLGRAGWKVASEVTYARYGERGSFDVLGLHERTGTALAVEVKTRFLSLESTLRKLDEKARLTPVVVQDRFGVRPYHVGRMLVLPEGSVSRRALAQHDEVLRSSFPTRGHAARAWLVDPASPAALLVLLREPSRSGPDLRFRRSSAGAMAGTASPSTLRASVREDAQADRLLSAPADVRGQDRVPDRSDR